MTTSEPTFVIDTADLDALFDALRRRGYLIIGPTRQDDAIVYDEISTAADLPAGWSDDQAAGRYTMRRRADDALFGYAVGPHSWKRYLLPPALRLWRARRQNEGFAIDEDSNQAPHLALLGVRACELSAIAIQDRVFLGAGAQEPDYRARRESIFVIAVDCGVAGGTCFCASMDTGPQARAGYDTALTEIIDTGEHFFVARAGSAAGAELLEEIFQRQAGEAERQRAERVVAQTAGQMGRTLDTVNIKELLYAGAEHPRWDEVASRCLSCANCTMVCPTCFCTTVQDRTELDGNHAERWRQWDSCFSVDFSYLHGGALRPSARSRYRQWLTHKFAFWIDQFGTSGCVGCGRCITWCPVGIDITEEIGALRGAARERES